MMFGGIAAFKAHCACVIHHEEQDAAGEGKGMGQLGKLASLDDLPPDEEIVARIRSEAEANVITSQQSASSFPQFN